MIPVHRIKGERLYVNADLIESIEVAEDTILTLVDGRRAVVSDTPEEIIEAIRAFRASVIVEADTQRATARAPGQPTLRVVRADEI